jgi:tetratricopeptide (TPR) repeat protein
MKRLNRFWLATIIACTLVLSAGVASSAGAQNQAPAKVHGTIVDSAGNPFPGILLTFKNSTTGQTFDVVTDAGGRYAKGGLPASSYSVSLKLKDMVIYEMVTELAAGQDTAVSVNFKDLQAKSGADAAEAEKKAAESRAKFAAMKGHFDAGTAALEQAKQLRAQIDKMPKDQQAASQGQLQDTAGKAVSELQQALEGTAETDPNRNIVLARLGDAYETTGKYTEAADAYTKAVALKPDPGYYNNLGNCLARTGKVDDALVAYQKAIELDPTNTAMYWRNFSVGLYNTGRIKESLDPLRKATAADPKNAQAWYLLGAALVNTMEFKQDGDKLVPVLQPGTIEAYQKSIDLDPNGPYAAQAKQGIDALQAMGVGIDTKVNQRPNTQQQKKK